MKRAKQAKKIVRKRARKLPRFDTVNAPISEMPQRAAQALRKAAKKSPQRKSDPFWIDERLIPVGWGYEWKVNRRPGGELPPGWSAVPYSRHAHDFPRSYRCSGSIVHKGLILVEALADQIASERWALQKDAQNQDADVRERLRMEDIGGGRRVWIMPDDWVDSYGRDEDLGLDDRAPQEGPPIEVSIALTIKVPSRWDSAAAYLKLTLAEYTRRRVLMDRPILGCTQSWNGSRDADPLYEPFLLNLAPKES